jgi:hypothetical protein
MAEPLPDAAAPCPTCQAAAESERAPESHMPCGNAVLFDLVGRIVLGVFVDPGEHNLYLVTDGGIQHYECRANCCSETWIADVTGFDALRDARVVSVRDLALPREDGRSRQDSDDFYGAEITTWRGRCHVAYRCSSNGYYGGWMERAPDPAELPAGLREIADDWSAP